jgi:hypothetical protein
VDNALKDGVLVAGHAWRSSRVRHLRCGAIGEMSALPRSGLTALLRIGVAEASSGLEYPVVIGATAGAYAYVDRRPREALARIVTSQLDLDVLVHDRTAGIAAGIAMLGS